MHTAEPTPLWGRSEDASPAGGTWSGDPRFAVPLAANVVVRPRLHAQLTAGVAAPCVLIAAPAGWGKTLLASSWLGSGGARGAVAWVSLSPSDDDLQAFWTSVADGLLPAVGDGVAGLLRNAVAGSDVESVPGRFAAALDATPVVLVLDNLHEITKLAVHESLLRLIHRPPPGLRFVVTTRHDPPWPLHRLRLAGVLTEIRASDLAFREDETRALLDRLSINLDAVHVGRLVERTEGWAAGLRLAALELHGVADPGGYVDAFSGDDHAVAAYLLEEVIDRLAPELLDFLVRVSILDVVSADLADALTGDRSGAVTLAELAASNLFVHAVGTGGRWYRLHRLIADVLRSRITQPRTFRDLHRRAAEWYLHQGIPLDAIRFAVRGGLWPLGAELLGRHILALAVRGNGRDVDLLLTAVPRDTLLGHPELAAALATARIMQGSPAELGELMAAAHAGVSHLPGPRAERLRVLLHLNGLGHARARGDLVGLATACRQIPTDPAVLTALGIAAWDVVPLIVLGGAGTAAFWTGDVVEAENHLRAAAEIDPSGGMLRPHLNARAHLALLHCERGDLDAAQNKARAVVEHAVEVGWTVSAQVVAAYLTLAWVALDRDDDPEADGWLGRVAEVEAVMPEPHVQLAAAGLTALRCADAGDVVGALSGLRLTTARFTGIAPLALMDRLLLVEADLLRCIGDLGRAGEVLAGLRGPTTAASARAVARVHLCSGDVAAAEEALAQFPRDGTTVRGRVEDAILRGLIAQTQDPAVALSWLDDALVIAAPLGMRRPFLVEAAELRNLLSARIEAGTAVAAFAVDLLRRMSGQGSVPPAVQAAPLTDRERLVLRYLASTLSNAEIASELYLSVNTVKTHQRMVYRKLGAGGRRDAVRRAKELRLL
jgi:LuxR family maltose regulon positive regulatory protein